MILWLTLALAAEVSPSEILMEADLATFVGIMQADPGRQARLPPTLPTVGSSRPAYRPRPWEKLPWSDPDPAIADTTASFQDCHEGDCPPGGIVRPFDTYAGRPPVFRRTVIVHELEHARFHASDDLVGLCRDTACNELMTYLRTLDLVLTDDDVQRWVVGTIDTESEDLWRRDPLTALKRLTAFRVSAYLLEQRLALSSPTLVGFDVDAHLDRLVEALKDAVTHAEVEALLTRSVARVRAVDLAEVGDFLARPPRDVRSIPTIGR